jgi:hypothetical protein
MRQVLGYYNSLTLAALYQFDSAGHEPEITVESFFPALKVCLATHPILSCTVSGAETEAPEWVRPETIDLRNHVRILRPNASQETPEDELKQLQEVLVQELDEKAPFTLTTPPWRILVLPVSQRPGEYYIILSISHALADGQACLAFHKSFLRGLNSSITDDLDPFVTPPSTPLLPSSDAIHMPVSWSYLLGPLLSVYLPKMISNALPFPQSYQPTAPNMWIATPYSYDASNHHTGLEIVVISPSTVAAALTACRAHNAKLTGLLHQIMLRALSAAIPDTPSAPAKCFGAQTAMNMRRLTPLVSNDDMAVLTNGDYEIFPRIPDSELSNHAITPAMWTAVVNTTAHLATAAISISDQPVGLLKYLGHFRMWLMNQMGKPRDISYELTNVLAFDPLAGEGAQEGRWSLGRTLMAQPANATGGPMSFNIASRKGGEMVVTISWQKGVLGFENEVEVIRGIGERVAGDLGRLAAEGEVR